MKASYKSHLSSPNSFISLVPIESTSLLNKIHQTHRLQYLKDVVLSRILEDSTHSMLNSAIYFNQVEIVNEVVGTTTPTSSKSEGGGGGVIEKVFEILDDKGSRGKGKRKGKEKEKEVVGPIQDVLDEDDEQRASKKPKLSTSPQPEEEKDHQVDQVDQIRLKKRQSIQFLTQLTQMSKNLQLPLRTSLYRTLVEKGLLKALEKALVFANNDDEEGEGKDLELRSQVIQVWMSVVDLDSKDVRAYCLNQGKEEQQEEEEEEAEEETTTTNRGDNDEKEGGESNKEEQAEKSKVVDHNQTMLGGLIETLKTEQDLGIKTHLAEALRVLLDAAGESGPLEVTLQSLSTYSFLLSITDRPRTSIVFN